MGCFSFFSVNKLVLAVNNSTAKDDDKRILLEAAHGSGYFSDGYDQCNHAKNTVDGVTYYENLEARIMIDKIAGYLKQANIPYEISNEIVGDAYFTNPGAWQTSGCSPESGDCCGFRQGTIGNYSVGLYSHIDSIGADKYLFALELHFNAAAGDATSNESVVMLRDVVEPYVSNAKKLTDAVDSVIGTSGSQVVNDHAYLDYNLGAVTNLYAGRKIPVYYLETFFMDNENHVRTYAGKKDELAKAIAQALIEIAGSSARLEDINSDDEEEWTGGRTDDPFKGFPLINSSNNFNCKAVLVDIDTGELNDLGKFLQDIFTIIKILGPVIAICLTIIDFIMLSF